MSIRIIVSTIQIFLAINIQVILGQTLIIAKTWHNITTSTNTGNCEEL